MNNEENVPSVLETLENVKQELDRRIEVMDASYNQVTIIDVDEVNKLYIASGDTAKDHIKHIIEDIAKEGRGYNITFTSTANSDTPIAKIVNRIYPRD